MDNLDFDRASYASPAGASTTCAACKSAITDQYWTLRGQILCSTCRGQARQALERSEAASSFAKALVMGSLTALVCGIGYAVFVALTGIQFGLITIGIAYVVAKVVRQASAGLSGRKFQVLAVLLTYCASCLGYFSALWNHGDVVWQRTPILFALPVLTATKAPIGLVIVVLGLWEAWRRARPIVLTVDGPFTVQRPSATPA
jgi:hypothetical protein